MGVLRSKRGIAYSEFERNMWKIHIDLESRMHALPVRYKKHVCDRLYEPMNRAYNALIIADEQKGSAQAAREKRQKYFKLGIHYLLQMEKPLMAFFNIRDVSENGAEAIEKALNYEIALIYGVAGWNKEEKPVFHILRKEKFKRLAFLGKMSDLHRYTFQKTAHAPNDCFDALSVRIDDFCTNALYDIRARIARSKAKREAKRLARAEKYGRMDRVMTNQNLFRSLMKRRKGTDWKQSVMDYCFHAIVRNKRSKDAVLAGAHPEPSAIKHITLFERGKRRDVHAVVIDSRVIQGVICDNCITRLTRPGLIHDNPANTIGKGVTWTRKRIMRQLRRQTRRTGRQTWALVFDIRHFFDTIRHDLCERIFRKVHMDDALISLAMYFIRMYQVFGARINHDADKMALLDDWKGIGVSLGSQISQDLALCAPNGLDHAVKDEAGNKTYMRYMDDGVALGSKADMNALREMVIRRAATLGFQLHETKTRIVKMSRGFIYLKIRYTATESGHIIRRMAREGILRMRRKLKKLHTLMRKGRVHLDDIYLSLKSWFGNAKKYAHSYRSRKRVLTLYHKLFKSYRMEGVIA